MTTRQIRSGRNADLPLLQRIEISAGQAFADIGMDEVAAHDPPTIEALRKHLTAGQLWVCTDDADTPIAYIVTDVVDGNLHIEQVSVHPGHAGLGVGHDLIEHVTGWAHSKKLPALTLTTFKDVPWNAPYYERLGFRYMDDGEIPKGLQNIRTAEREIGLDQWVRVCMIRML